MKQEQLKSAHGYEIPCVNQIGAGKKTVLICHGFGSSKDSPMVHALREELPQHGIGTYSFDFPAHGESRADSQLLRIFNCLSDLETVEAQVRRLSPTGELCYFGSSFGAYILLLHLARKPHSGKRAFLRSAAVCMYDIFLRGLLSSAPDWQPSPSGNPIEDFFVMDYAYSREMRITRAFLDDLKQNDIFKLYPARSNSLFFIHGGADNVAPVEDTVRFAKMAGAPVQILPEAEHRLMGEGELEQVLTQAVRFLSCGP